MKYNKIKYFKRKNRVFLSKVLFFSIDAIQDLLVTANIKQVLVLRVELHMGCRFIPINPYV